MGGLGGIPVLQPGERHTVAATLLRYALIAEPGLYTVDVRYDFGWEPTPARPIPSASLKLRFSEPDAAHAQAIAARAGAPHRLPSADTHADSFGDYTSLRHPLYLPVLKTQADAGTVFAVLGIGHIKGSEATAALLELAGNPAATAEVRLAAMKMLAARAPYPPTSHYHFPDIVISAEQLRVDAWTDALRAAALRLARNAVSDDSASDTDFVPPALSLMSALGRPEDAPRLLAILDANLIDTLPGGGVPHPQSRRIHEALEALRSLRMKGWMLSEEPVRPAEIYLTFYLVEREQLPHTDRIERLALAHLAHPSLTVRRSAYDALRHPVPETHLPQARADFALDIRGLRDAVRSMIWRTYDRRLLPEVLARLENNQDRHQQGQLIGLALALTGPREVIPMLIDQLDRASTVNETLDQLVSLVINRPPSSYRGVNWDQSDLDALQAAWRTFYARHGERILTGGKLAPDDRRVPATLFGGRYDWAMRGR